jgi:hypothetical protein
MTLSSVLLFQKGEPDSFQKEKLCLYDLGTSPELFTENITFTALERDPERGEPALFLLVLRFLYLSEPIHATVTRVHDR